MTAAHLVLVETSGNQNYIFATNKLRENVGASELTFRVGTRFVLEAVHDLGGPDLWKPNNRELRHALQDDRNNSPLTNSSYPIEVILAVSGKALLLVREEGLARALVSAVSRRALKETPGIDVRGVVGSRFDLAQDPIHERVGHVYRELEAIRGRLPAPGERFQRLPVVAECKTSGLPAARFDTSLPVAGEHAPRSRVSLAKQEATEAGLNRICRLVGEILLPHSTTDLENLGCEWLAVVHADGNGLGQVFLKFDEHIQSPRTDALSSNRFYIDQLRRFSLALDCCTEKAFCAAIRLMGPRGGRSVVPVVPLVLGGDDLTVVCDGQQALRFTKTFIDAFERETGADTTISTIMRKTSCQGKVTSCAGVAIIKPHFPFHASYGLAEELLKSAKKCKPKSAIDFHMLYDASGADLERIRRELTKDGGATLLVARPYMVTPGQEPPGRFWGDLVHRVEAVTARDDDKRRRLPNNMLHELREALFCGREIAEARLALVRDRYRPYIDHLLVDDNLFWKEDGTYRTGLLDAMDLAEFWEGQR